MRAAKVQADPPPSKPCAHSLLAKAATFAYNKRESNHGYNNRKIISTHPYRCGRIGAAPSRGQTRKQKPQQLHRVDLLAYRLQTVVHAAGDHPGAASPHRQGSGGDPIRELHRDTFTRSVERLSRQPMIYTLYFSRSAEKSMKKWRKSSCIYSIHLPSEGMNEPTGGHIGLPLLNCLVPLT